MGSKLCLSFLWLLTLTFCLARGQSEMPEAVEEVLSNTVDPDEEKDKIEDVLDKAEMRVHPSDVCLDCMCAVQSGDGVTPGCGLRNWWEGDGKCGGSGCISDRKRCRCGPYLLTEEQFEDCSEAGYLPYKDFRTCAWNYDCARMCLREYISKYVVRCTGNLPERITCSNMARLLYGGNEGCKPRKTRPFGRKVARCMKRNIAKE